jgi:hypothetical protein
MSLPDTLSALRAALSEAEGGNKHAAQGKLFHSLYALQACLQSSDRVCLDSPVNARWKLLLTNMAPWLTFQGHGFN